MQSAYQLLALIDAICLPVISTWYMHPAFWLQVRNLCKYALSAGQVQGL